MAAAHALLEGEYRDRTEIALESKTLINGLGIEPSECYRASDHIAVFDASSDVEARSPDFKALAELDLRGVIVTAPGESEDFVSRFFAPKFGIDEDPVTGSAHCTLAPDWADKLGKDILAATQVSKRTGLLICKVADDREFISGRTVDYLEGQIEIEDVYRPGSPGRR